MELDPFMLSRLQFAANISFHILFPTLTIGLSWLLFYFRIRFTVTGNHAWEDAYYFWVKIFALTFALGVVTGITMSFQFGTNWPGFMERVGNIAGPLLGYEVLTAFFLEASFLGIMLFGKSRVSNRLHLVSTAMVAIGTSLSAFWILSLNSWMQSPTGYYVVDGVYFVESWIDVIFNPTFPYRLGHKFIACLITASFFVAGISAWRIRKNKAEPANLVALRTAVMLAALLTPVQIFLGDRHGLNTLEHQPAKIAAIEALWETQNGAPLVLFGFPDEKTRTTHAAIEIPRGASLILTHDSNGKLLGLNEFEGEHPPVAIVFWSFRVMVGIGILMLLVSWWSALSLRRSGMPGRFQLWVISAMTFSGWVAVLAGWYVTEVGRQPWLVNGLIKSSEVVAQHDGGTVLSTLVAYCLLYLFLLISYIAALNYLSGKPIESIEKEINYGKVTPPPSAGNLQEEN